MSGFVVAVGSFLMIGMLGVMSRSPNAEWDIIALATTGLGLLALAFTLIWRTRAIQMAWWEVAEAAIQYAVSGGLLAKAQPTLMFNGYNQVASLYEGMDLTKNF